MAINELPTIEKYRSILGDIPRAEYIINKVTETFGKYLIPYIDENGSDVYLIDVLYLYFIKKVPDYFWTVPASSSGKYHPSFDNVEGGLVNHTCMNCEVALELFRLKMFEDITTHELEVIIALIIHDLFKNGYGDDFNYTIFAHPSIAADEFCDTLNWYLKQTIKGNKTLTSGKELELRETVDFISSSVQTHMGQWGRVKPSTSIQNFVHLCDYIASRKFFDIYKSVGK
nr:MAG TPA: putative cytosolic protein [Bacteriophage sp.]